MTTEHGSPLSEGDAAYFGDKTPMIPTRSLSQPLRPITINTLAKDIYYILDGTKVHIPNTALAADYAMKIGGEFAKASLKRSKPRGKGKLWASDLGKRCLRQAWYKFNTPEHEEKLDGHTKFKFLYGNILEEAVLYFAEEAGHTVAHPQHTVEHTTTEGWTIRGRIDAVIDGKLIDVKSTSSYGYKRYKDGINASNDSFGYIEQLAFYTLFNDIQPQPEAGGFVWIDKQNGNICYTPVAIPSMWEIKRRASVIIDAIESTEKLVQRGYAPEPYGKSGNMKLPIGCAYCPYKAHCYRGSNGGKGLRGFHYNQGPIWFAEVVREPNCPEIKT